MVGCDFGAACGNCNCSRDSLHSADDMVRISFLDDHELFRIEQSANQGQPLLTTVKAWILNDLRVRYRPLYWTERVTVGYLFGSNLTAWNIWTAVKGVLRLHFCI